MHQLQSSRLSTAVPRRWTKRILLGKYARDRLLAGCDTAVDAMQVTLGPRGRNVLIEQPFGGPKITKDGVTVAKAVELKDRVENMGAQFIKDVASNTNDTAGDGTTTASVLARSLLRGTVEASAHGANPMELLKGMEWGLDRVTTYLEARHTPVKTHKDILDVATLSANGDPSIGSLVADAFHKVGIAGTVTVAEGRTSSNELEFVDGMRLNRGFLSPYFINNSKTNKVEFDSCHVLLYEKKISSLKSMLPLLEEVIAAKVPLLILCEDLDSDVLAMLLLNKIRIGLDVCAVKAPGFGDGRRAQLEDIAAAIGGTVLREEAGQKMEDLRLADLGMAQRVVVSKDETVIVSPATADRQEVAKRVEGIQEELKDADTEYDREKLQERLARLQGGVAIIKVGGSSDLEVSERKDRVQDAICATKSALEEGVLPGGGSALLFAADETLREEDIAALPFEEQRLGARILRKACAIPVARIAENAGYEGQVVAGNLLRDGKFGQCFDARTGRIVDVASEGILDPTKVVKSALSDAVRGAALLGTTEALIAEVESEKPVSGVSGF